MPAERFYLKNPFTPKQEVVLADREAHHLLNVMRARPGDRIELINGKNQLAEAELISTHKREAILQITKVDEGPLPSHRVTLCQAIPRLNRLDTIIEKTTELGVHAIWLFPGERSERKSFSTNQWSRLQTIAISAIKQSGRLDLPEIALKPPLTEWQSPPFPAYFGDLDTSAPPFKEVWKESSDLLFFIGPEAGFSSSETTHLENLKAKGVRLHSNILRTDTAPIVALSLITHWLIK